MQLRRAANSLKETKQSRETGRGSERERERERGRERERERERKKERQKDRKKDRERERERRREEGEEGESRTPTAVALSRCCRTVEHQQQWLCHAGAAVIAKIRVHSVVCSLYFV